LKPRVTGAFFIYPALSFKNNNPFPRNLFFSFVSKRYLGVEIYLKTEIFKYFYLDKNKKFDILRRMTNN